MAAVNSAERRGRSSRRTRRSKSNEDERGRGTGRRRRKRGSAGGEHSGLQSPSSEREVKSPEVKDRRKKKIRSQSLPRDTIMKYEDSDTENRTVRGRKRDKGRGRSRGRERSKSRRVERERMAEGEEGEQEQELPEVEARVEEKMEEKESNKMNETTDERLNERVDLKKEQSEEEVALPIPNPTQRLPRPVQNWEVENDEHWDVTAEYRGLRRDEGQQREEGESLGDDRGDNKNTGQNEDVEEDEAQYMSFKKPLPGVAVIDVVSQREPFSFLTSTLSEEQLGGDESESGGSQSDGSVSAASISGLSLIATEAGGRRAAVLPGPWLTPSKQRLAQFAAGNQEI